MKKVFIIFALIGLSYPMMLKAQKNPLSSAIEVKTLQCDNEGAGFNGLAVTYNPTLKLYYTLFAGNSTYPLEVFDAGSKHLSTSEPGWDARGLWYNPGSNTLVGTAYNGGGLYSKPLNSFGYPSGDPTIINYSSPTPVDQAVAVKDPATGTVFMYYKGKVTWYHLADFKSYKVTKLKISKKNHLYLKSTMIYTGITGYEFGLLNDVTKELVLFNSNGIQTAKVSFQFISFNLQFNFNFSYDGKNVWIFNTNTRTWHGYEIFTTN